MRARALLGSVSLLGALAVGSAAAPGAEGGLAETAIVYDEVKAPGSPVAPIVTTVTQPDGETFQAIPWGDSALEGLETPDGFTVVQTAGGEWRYADGHRDDGSLQPGAARPDGDPAPDGIDPHQRPEASQVDTVAMPMGSPMAGVADAPFRPSSGAARTLVILADFTDQTPTTTEADWAGRFFGATNSVEDYYEEVSYGALDVQPAAETGGTANNGVVNWVALPYPHPNVGVTDFGPTKQALARDAIVAANSKVNYSAFDTNGNGVVEPRELHVTVILAGYETSYTGRSNLAALCGSGVWGHAWSLDGWVGSQQWPDVTPKLDGVFVGGHGGTYTMFGEKHCIRPNDPVPTTGHLATIGIMVHELGHDLGWPDLYDTSSADAGGSSQGLGFWSVMAQSWGSSPASPEAGSMPTHPDAWSKLAQGWVVPKQVTGPVTIQQAETVSDVHQILPNPKGVDWNFFGSPQVGTGEYFLVENRQQVSYDQGLPGNACGLVIYHVDETRPKNNLANSVEARKLVDVEEADGFADLDTNFNAGDEGDTWPGTSAKTAFNDASNPNSRLYGASGPSGVSVSGISACGSSMTATIASPGPFPPGVPTIGTVTAGKKADAKVGFTPPVDTGGGQTTYVATCKSSNGGVTRSKSGGSSPLTVANLTAGKSYTCRVLASNVAGSSTQSAPSNTITAVKPPGAPTDVTATKGNNSAKVSFDPPSSTGGTPITGYEARCKSSNGGVTKSKAGTGTTITVAGLTQGKSYRCAARAKNAAGFGAYSSQSNQIVPT